MDGFLATSLTSPRDALTPRTIAMWLNHLGAALDIDPELFFRHLDIMPRNVSNNPMLLNSDNLIILEFQNQRISLTFECAILLLGIR